MIMKTTMKFMTSFLIAFALVVLAACQKDNLQDAVIPQEAVAENTTNSSGGTDGQTVQMVLTGQMALMVLTAPTAQMALTVKMEKTAKMAQTEQDGATGPQGDHKGLQGPAGPARSQRVQKMVQGDGADGATGTCWCRRSRWQCQCKIYVRLETHNFCGAAKKFAVKDIMIYDRCRSLENKA